MGRPPAPRSNRHPRRPWRRTALLAVTLAGCWSTWNPGQSAGSCDLPPLGLGLFSWGPSSAFTFQCPAGGGDDGGAPALDAGDTAGDASPTVGTLQSFVAASRDRSNLACVIPLLVAYTDAWHVGVGAPFGLQLPETAPDGGTGATLIAQPVVPSIATSTPRGWVMPRPGFLGFTASNDAGVVDSTNVVATPVASLKWLWQTPGGSIEGIGIEASPGPLIGAAAGDEVEILVLPEGEDGAGAVAGSIECSFASSDPSRLVIQGDGLAAVASALGAGQVSVTAACSGVTGQATVAIAGPAGDANSDNGDTNDDGNAADATVAGDEGPVDAADDRALDGGG